MALRPYQARDIERVRDAFRRRRAVLYQLPTGGGKTHVFVEVAERVASRGGRVLVLEHRAELVAQAVSKLRAVGAAPGVVCASAPDATFSGFESVVVASIQTLTKRDLGAWRPTFIVADEAHLSVAASWRAAFARWPTAWRLGVTATPERLDGRGLGEIFGEMVKGPTIAELTDAGHLVPARVYAPPAPDFSTLPIRGGDFAAVPEAVANGPQLVGDVVDHYQRLGAGRTAIVFASSIAHAAKLGEAFKAAGLRAGVLTGKSSPTHRRRCLADLSSGRLDVLVNVGVLIEGFDCPRVSYVALARPTASLTIFLQAVGRGLRPFDGKADCIVADHAGNAADRFGLPGQDRPWTLAGRGRRHRGVDPDAIAVATCPRCLALYQSTPCPRCGHTPATTPRRLRQVGGLLRELTAAEVKAREVAASQRLPERDAPSWAPPALWARLEAKRRREGYAPGWTIGACRSRMGGRRR